MQCFAWLAILAVAVVTMATLLRWFELTAQAVEQRRWGRVSILVVLPFSAWLYPGGVSAGRPLPVPHHEPVRGFGEGPAANAGKDKLARDADPAEKLRRKMRQQGMLDDDEAAGG